MMVKLLKQNKEIIQSGDDALSIPGEPLNEYQHPIRDSSNEFINTRIDSSIGINLRSSTNDLKSINDSHRKILRKVKSQQNFKATPERDISQNLDGRFNMAFSAKKEIGQQTIQSTHNADLSRQYGEKLRTIESSDSFDSEYDFTVGTISHSLPQSASSHDVRSLSDEASESNLAMFSIIRSQSDLAKNEKRLV